ncbi:ATP-binding cassette domain-containing protein [Actinoplanes sp. Pm04-4]|uniref:ATP-binding cassette domain-containing protein n=1 Tax=Paractinoplanes pyxinae TaxID=2997416 RepID=A0ABT4BFD3_9ACTN|nr:ATP-binding cassette domain-containing protein [Actinoplanes pyxinae]MCY1145234.1 ATP-binding cassette domain-containing protein [Actinoplanes pyxinae]
MPVLIARGAGVRQRRRRGRDPWLFRDLDVTVEPGDLVAVTGPPGSGRTTMLLALARRFRLNAGSVELHGRASLGYVPEVSIPEPVFTVTEHVRERLMLLGRPRSEAAGVDLHGLDPQKQGQDLSPYEKQVLGLVLAQLAHPAVIALDAYDDGLDSRERDTLWHLITTLTASGTAVILTTRKIDPTQVTTVISLGNDSVPPNTDKYGLDGAADSAWAPVSPGSDTAHGTPAVSSAGQELPRAPEQSASEKPTPSPVQESSAEPKPDRSTSEEPPVGSGPSAPATSQGTPESPPASKPAPAGESLAACESSAEGESSAVRKPSAAGELSAAREPSAAGEPSPAREASAAGESSAEQKPSGAGESSAAREPSAPGQPSAPGAPSPGREPSPAREPSAAGELPAGREGSAAGGLVAASDTTASSGASSAPESVAPVVESEPVAEAEPMAVCAPTEAVQADVVLDEEREHPHKEPETPSHSRGL